MIRGETDHYDYVCAEAARGIQDVQLRTGVPCAFGVLTVDTMEQALARTGGDKRDSGRHAAEAVLALARCAAAAARERRIWRVARVDAVRLRTRRDTGRLAAWRKEILAIALTLLVHVIALVALVWTLLGDPEDRPDWRDWWPRRRRRSAARAVAGRRGAATSRCPTPCRAPCACASRRRSAPAIRVRRAARRIRPSGCRSARPRALSDAVAAVGAVVARSS